MSNRLTDERLQEIYDSPWIGVNPSPIAGEALRLRAEVNRLSKELSESTSSLSQMFGRYIESQSCSTTVPEDPCFDCIRCLRLRLKERV